MQQQLLHQQCVDQLPLPQQVPQQQQLTVQKECTKCRQTKLLEFFFRDPSKRFGHTSWCKACFGLYSQERKLFNQQLPGPKLTEKQCSICHAVKPASDFIRDARRATGLDARCRQCRREQHKARKAARAASGAPTATEKACRRCKVVKPASAFKKHSYTASGLDSWCKACCAERRKEKPLKKVNVPTIDSKRCLRCRLVKSAEEFTRDTNKRTGLGPRCKGCENEYRKEKRMLKRSACSDPETCQHDAGPCGRQLLGPMPSPPAAALEPSSDEPSVAVQALLKVEEQEQQPGIQYQYQQHHPQLHQQLEHGQATKMPQVQQQQALPVLSEQVQSGLLLLRALSAGPSGGLCLPSIPLTAFASAPAAGSVQQQVKQELQHQDLHQHQAAAFGAAQQGQAYGAALQQHMSAAQEATIKWEEVALGHSSGGDVLDYELADLTSSLQAGDTLCDYLALNTDTLLSASFDCDPFHLGEPTSNSMGAYHMLGGYTTDHSMFR